MKTQDIINMGLAWKQVTEKMSSKEKMAKGLYNGKMDPVGQADADIDNDGDVDKSDKYLHNRRKAIKKNMKEGDAQSADKKPQMYIDPTTGKKKVRMVPTDDKIVDKDANEATIPDGQTAMTKKPDLTKKDTKTIGKIADLMKHANEDVEENKAASIAKKLAKSAASSAAGKAAVTLPKAPFEIPKKESVEANQELEMVTEYSKPNSVSRMREAMMQMFQEAADRADHYKGASKPDGMKDNLKGKGAKDMADQPTEVDDTEEKGHDDVSKAGRAGPTAKARSNDNMKGDKAVVNPVKK